jgi:hypothetical protein
MLKRLLRWLWCPGPCRQAVYREGPVADEFGIIGWYFDMRCETCGRITRQNHSVQ